MSRDNRVQQATMLHPDTVTDVSRKVLDGESSPYVVRTRNGSSRPATAPVEHQQFHPAIWQLALDAADGDPRRLLAHSLTRLEVLNHPRPAGTSVWAPGAKRPGQVA